MKTFKPMLSATLTNIDAIKYPVLVSPKLDGYRCIILGGQAMSRNLKPIKNKYIQHMLAHLPDGLDGELIVGKPNATDVWSATSSGVTREEGEPDFTFHVFDYAPPAPNWHDVPFSKRLWAAKLAIESNEYCLIVPHHEIRDRAGLDYIEQRCVTDGYEGVMLRDPHGSYKFGRSTEREGGLMKLKRWHDADAKVVGMIERMHNGNEAETDALGRTKRSTAKAGKSGRGDMGALVCQIGNVRFELGTGFTDKQRADIWSNPHLVIGKLVEFKYQQLTADGVPRFPVFHRIRAEE